ncbi:hypothetical protein QAD02_007166 [Eretmocerus hayati]|uniref:Uncharacterized protein n=1 Tax=Eretmocerus hayati TaxID=131215 RepID=A0ACC2N384_9HYME|nr:hypothetical protein QAD02_007166 [Eretmocerus hayati]
MGVMISDKVGRNKPSQAKRRRNRLKKALGISQNPPLSPEPARPPAPPIEPPPRQSLTQRIRSIHRTRALLACPLCVEELKPISRIEKEEGELYETASPINNHQPRKFYELNAEGRFFQLLKDFLGTPAAILLPQCSHVEKAKDWLRKKKNQS